MNFDDLPNLNPEYLVSKIVDRKIPVMDVVCNPFLAEPALITEVAKALALAAAKLGFKDVLADLGHSSSTPIEDMVLRDIPEASPVTRKTVRLCVIFQSSSCLSINPDKLCRRGRIFGAIQFGISA